MVYVNNGIHYRLNEKEITAKEKTNKMKKKMEETTHTINITTDIGFH